MKRLYFLAHTLDSVEKISTDLHLLGIDDWHLHVLSRNEAGLYHRQIHSIHIFQQNDVIHSGELGALTGGFSGLLIALILELWTPFGSPLPTSALILIAGVFTLFGAWSGGLIGITRENYKTARFHDELENGKHLIMVDVALQKEKEVCQQISRYHCEVSLAGSETAFTSPLARSFWCIPKHR